jgi:RNA polymerase sigma-70 factor (ECF subfamily)
LAATIEKDPVTRSRPREGRSLAREAQADPGGSAFRQLYEAHQEATFRFLLGLTGERGLAEDAMQDAWFQVHQHLDRYDGSRPFKPWLHQVVRNAGLNVLRARRKAPVVEANPQRRAISDRVLKGAALQEASEVAEQALAAIASDARALLIERYALELKQAALAESYGCTERTIRNRLHAALDELTRAVVEARQGGAQ